MGPPPVPLQYSSRTSGVRRRTSTVLPSADIARTGIDPDSKVHRSARNQGKPPVSGSGRKTLPRGHRSIHDRVRTPRQEAGRTALAKAADRAPALAAGGSFGFRRDTAAAPPTMTD